MNKQVVLTKKQAQAIEWVSDNYGNPSTIRMAATKIEPKLKFWSKPETIALNGLTFDELASALYAGYTVEKTQEEREMEVKELYASAHSSVVRVDTRGDILLNQGRMQGVSRTLDLLGIEIQGVNA
ncbi:hypothetical protein [Bacillus sp. Marseille-P3800]|uniref:hypothetical protein n=1 Tax=Bacillus sp. Marseille-P3800 TaxID=2014782 RepID=UPI000C06B7A8|nr:hypothetical protein [Bacillus sp. Marseille-P3800]